MRYLVHASAELLEAMRGNRPQAQIDFGARPHASAADPACGVRLEGRDLIVLAYFRGNCSEPKERGIAMMHAWPTPRPLEVNCPACLSLMAQARGPDWDVVQERKEAARQKVLEAVHNDFIDREIERYHASEFAKRGFVRSAAPAPPEPEKS